jgi:anaerobic selenocysteine-containing dehydrogenase
MDPGVLPQGYDTESATLRPTTVSDATGPRLHEGDKGFREHVDGLIKARDVIRINDAQVPDIGGEYRYSYCAQCNHMPKCGVKAVVKEGKVIRLERRERYGNELPCALGNAATQDLYAPDRLLTPQRRTNPKGEPARWEPISWDEALEEIALRINAVKEAYGAEKILFMTGDVKEPKSALQRLSYSFGSPHFATESSTCFNAAELAVRLVLGTETRAITSLVPGPPPDINDTKVAIFWAHNPGTSAAFSYDRLKTTREFSNIKYIVIDPRVTSTTENFADVHLQLRPGTDGAIALFLADQLISRGAYDKEFVAKWTHGFEAYRELAARYDRETTARITGVSAERLQQAADILVENGAPITIKSSSAFPHHTNGTDNFRAMFLLVPLTGSLDVEGGHLIVNEPLEIDMWGGSFPFARVHELLPDLNGLRLDRQHFPVWADADRDGCFQINHLPEYVQSGELRAAVLLGVNTMMWPQTHEYQQAFRDMEFVVAADFRIRPATHDYVDLLLPAAMPLERSAPLSLVGRKLFLREPAVRPQGAARSDYRICADIGTALGLGPLFWNGGEEAESEMLREVLRTAGGPTQPSLEDLQAASPDGVPIPLENGIQFRKWELGLLRKDGKPGFSTPSGKVEFASEYLREHGFDPLPLYREPYQSPVSTPDLAERFPLILSSGSRVPYFCHSLDRTLPWLVRYLPEPTVYLGLADARARGLRDGDSVRITSPANIEGITAKLAITNTLFPGMMDMHHGWPQSNVNELIPRVFDPISGFPAYREGLCEISPLAEAV